MDEAAVRASLAGLTAPDGAPLLAADAVADVVIEGDWIAVVLGKEGVPRELVARVHRGLTVAFPGVGRASGGRRPCAGEARGSAAAG